MSEKTEEQLLEEQQATALRAVREAARERDRVNALAQEEVELKAVNAARIGTSRTRVREEAGVSPRVFYSWLEAAGLPVRAKTPKRSKKDK